MTQETGKWIIIVALVILIIGIIVYLFGDKLGWVGNLPGDINYKKGNTRVYFPITTMIILSLLLNAVLYIIRKWM